MKKNREREKERMREKRDGYIEWNAVFMEGTMVYFNKTLIAICLE